MADTLPSHYSSKETESEGAFQVFDCVGVPVAPGTKAHHLPGRTSGSPMWGVRVLLVLGLLLIGGLAGWLLSRF